jgi:outer membrane lipoprotein-sorting protein
MKSKLTLLIAILCVAAAAAFGQAAKPAAPAKLPTAQEIVAKYTKAIGGREAMEKIKSWTTKGTVEISPMGLKGTFEQIASAPDRSMTTMSITGLGDLIEGYDGKTAWAINPIQGSRERTGAELLQTKLMSNFYRDVNLDKLYPKMEVKGIEKVNGKDAYVVTATPDGLPAATMYFDVQSGLIVRSDNTLIAPEGQQQVSIYIEEMKQVDGVMVPTKMRTKLPTFEMLMTVTEVKSGPTIEDAKFARPKS